MRRMTFSCGCCGANAILSLCLAGFRLSWMSWDGGRCTLESCKILVLKKYVANRLKVVCIVIAECAADCVPAARATCAALIVQRGSSFPGKYVRDWACAKPSEVEV